MMEGGEFGSNICRIAIVVRGAHVGHIAFVHFLTLPTNRKVKKCYAFLPCTFPSSMDEVMGENVCPLASEELSEIKVLYGETTQLCQIGERYQKLKTECRSTHKTGNDCRSVR